MRHLLSLALHHDQDVVTARHRAAELGQLLGFDTSEQTRVATAVSEIVRNAFRYATGGNVDVRRRQRIQAASGSSSRVTDRGPGIQRLDDVLAGRYQSATGMGMGIVGARRLMDDFSIDSTRAAPRSRSQKFLSPRHEVVTAERAAADRRRRSPASRRSA